MENKIREWYADQRKCKVEEFDDYDLHVCRVVHAYVQQSAVNEPEITDEESAE